MSSESKLVMFFLYRQSVHKYTPSDCFWSLCVQQQRGNLALKISCIAILVGFRWSVHCVRYLSNIFVDFYKSRLLEKYRKRCVDDTFSIFDSIKDSEAFHPQLSSFNSCLLFTMELENNCNLPFVDILAGLFVTSVYRKPTFTCLVINRKKFY